MKNNKPMIIFGEPVLPGENRTINVEIARLHTTTKLNIPVIVRRSKIDGPVVLFSAGIHGDEINGVEIVRQIISKKINRPTRGTIICIPIINMYGFVNKSREFPDGRDLNRVFPGSKKGSLASRFAFHIVAEILPIVDYAVDFHAGGASRFNAPQIRVTENNPELRLLADVFNAPFTLYSKNITGSFRNTSEKANVKMLLFEGGKSLDINNVIANEGVMGVKRLLHYLEMLDPKQIVEEAEHPSIYIKHSVWLRAKCSGLLHDYNLIGKFVTKGTILAIITDPFGKFEQKVKAPHDGFIINANHSPIVYEGDAIYHISKTLLMATNKKELRLQYKNLRAALSLDDIEEKSLSIANSLIQLPIWDKTYYHIFLPIEEQKEINTEYILHLLSGKDKEIVVSKSDFETRKMSHFLLTDNTKIKKNEYNIPEPVNGLPVPSETIELVFVPLLAFDTFGNRIGYGKGFYDKFLAECKPETIKIGLSFFEAVNQIDDVFESDVTLDYCVTPEQVYKF